MCRAAGGSAEAVSITGAALVEAGREALPFTLTEGQERALASILADLAGPNPMMCLLQASTTTCRLVQYLQLPRPQTLRPLWLIWEVYKALGACLYPIGTVYGHCLVVLPSAA